MESSRTSLLLLLTPCFSSDSPLQGLCIASLQFPAGPNGYPCKSDSTVTADGFYFTGLSVLGNTSNIFGSYTTNGNVQFFTALNTFGISMNRVDFAVGGINHPHTHPRASEMVLVTKGKLLVGFVTSDNVYFSKYPGVWDVFVYPRGLVHFQYNVGTEEASVITVLDSQLPGAPVVSVTRFGSKPSIPEEVLAKGFGVEEQLIEDIKSKFGAYVTYYLLQVCIHNFLEM